MMNRTRSEDLLQRLRPEEQDTKRRGPAAQFDFSVISDEMQGDETVPARIEPVQIRDGLKGSWIGGEEGEEHQAVLFFHAGGFTSGSTHDHLGVCSRISSVANARVFSVDYRLAPDHVFPVQVEDAVAAYTYLLSRGIPSHRIIPAGLSVGGTLVLALLLSARDRHLPLPPAAVCFSPLVDMLFCGESVSRNIGNDWLTPELLAEVRTAYLAGHDQEDPLASPLHASLHDLPRLYIQAGTHELLLSDIACFVDRARWAGVPVRFELWEGMFHCWQAFAHEIPEGEEALALAGAFIRDAISR